MGYSPCICKTGALAVCACLQWQEDSHTAYLAMQLKLHTMGCFAALLLPPNGAAIFASDSLPYFICGRLPAIIAGAACSYTAVYRRCHWQTHLLRRCLPTCIAFGGRYILLAAFLYNCVFPDSTTEKLYMYAAKDIHILHFPVYQDISCDKIEINEIFYVIRLF